MAYTFSAAKGGKIGTSLLEADKMELANEFMTRVKESYSYLQIQLQQMTSLIQQKSRQLPAGEIPDGFMGLDIGPESVKKFQDELVGAKTVFWNGPMGVFELPNFAKGTIGVCEAIANLEGATTIIGGGDYSCCCNLTRLR